MSRGSRFQASVIETERIAKDAGEERPGPRVSVVITTYNHAHFLAEALESVLTQTHAAEEIVVVDDGSADDPAAVAGRFAGVKLIRQANQGLAAARNTGLHAVHSEHVIFLDADDRLLPNAIAAGLACFARAPGSAFVYGGHRRIDQAGRPLGEDIYYPVSAQAYRDLLKGNLVGMHATVMYDRTRLSEAGGFDVALRRCEDYDVYLRLARSLPVASHPQIVAEYRWHGSNMSSNHREMLGWVLHVHRREGRHASASAETAGDWREGREIWRRYYAEEILRAAKADWSAKAGLAPAARGMMDALAVSPSFTARVVVERAVRRATRSLPSRWRHRLGQCRGDPLTPPLGSVRLGDLDRVTPISADFGFDRGTPIDRYYIEQFLASNAAAIRGRVLEVGDDAYSRRFGGERVAHQDILHVSADNPVATIVGDLSQPDTLPGGVFDCLVLTQTLHLIFDLRAALVQMHRALKPGGVALVTVPGISQIDRGAWGGTWFWSLTQASAVRLFSPVFGAANVRVESHGNVFAAIAFLQGLAVEEVDTAKLRIGDPCYPVTVAVRARKAPDAAQHAAGEPGWPA
jgi:glycosyltransferase involved in cell wall biosynthesis/SAM-dependent methyltransferase